MAPLRSSTTVILQPPLNGLFFFYIRMYKCKTISELHLPKTSFATASQNRKSEPNPQEGLSLTFVLSRSSVWFSSVFAQTNALDV